MFTNMLSNTPKSVILHKHQNQFHYFFTGIKQCATNNMLKKWKCYESGSHTLLHTFRKLLQVMSGNKSYGESQNDLKPLLTTIS